MDKIKLTSAMVIFGTIGLFVKGIGMPSSVIAAFRGAIGALFLVIIYLFSKKKNIFSNIKSKLPMLCISGIAIGINWILLFESYRYTTVAVATLCYYMSPVIVLLLSPFILSEKLTVKKVLCIVAAFFGMLLVSGVLDGEVGTPVGIILGLGAAAVYASIIFMNKKITDVDPMEKTIIQLSAAAVSIIPYCLLTVSSKDISLDTKSIVLLLCVAVLHTGIAYFLYFSSLAMLNSNTIAVLSYIDPVVAVILSAIILKEKTDIYGIVGAVLIIGAALVSEIPVFEKRKTVK